MSPRTEPSSPSGRLARIDAAWPARVSLTQVRKEQPNAVRHAALGWVVLLCVPPMVVLTAALYANWPFELVLPDAIDWLRPLLLVAAFFGVIMLVTLGSTLAATPMNVKRRISLTQFGQALGLKHSLHGAASPTVGVFFAEQLPSTRETPNAFVGKLRASAKPLFLTSQVLWSGVNSDDPDLQVGLASYQGGKNDRKGPRLRFRYLSLRLPRRLPHIIIDARGNGQLRTFIPGSQRLSLEGDFDRYFAVYVPIGYERDGLELLTPRCHGVSDRPWSALGPRDC